MSSTDGIRVNVGGEGGHVAVGDDGQRVSLTDTLTDLRTVGNRQPLLIRLTELEITEQILPSLIGDGRVDQNLKALIESVVDFIPLHAPDPEGVVERLCGFRSARNFSSGTTYCPSLFSLHTGFQSLCILDPP
ncbi:MAG: hypothetical protein JSU73_03880, partial [candidate division WOR-3 bacterium]